MNQSIIHDLKILLSTQPESLSTIADEVRTYPLASGHYRRTETNAEIENHLIAMRGDGSAEYVPGKGWRRPAVNSASQGSLF